MIEIPIIILIIGLVYFWYNQVQALDNARITAKKITIDKNWAFLDDSVIQKHISIKPFLGKLAILREFQFEFSDTHTKRHKGSVIHHAQSVTEIKFYHSDGIETYQLKKTQ